jgi:hypothetical protein
MPKENMKQNRIKRLIGIRNTLNNTETRPSDLGEGYYSYNQEKIKQVLATVDDLLANDGVKPANQ